MLRPIAALLSYLFLASKLNKAKNLADNIPMLDYSLPQSCPANTDPHLPGACLDPEHAVLAMSDGKYAALQTWLTARDQQAAAGRLMFSIDELNRFCEITSKAKIAFDECL